MATHNRYSTLEAHALSRELSLSAFESGAIEPSARRRRWAQRDILARVPARGLLRFVYMCIFRLGFLGGFVGFHLCRFIGAYDDLIAMKLHAIWNGYDPGPMPAKRDQ